MKNVFDKFITERHHLIVGEDDVINTLRVIQKHNKLMNNMAVGNCDWENGNNWFIHFTTTRANWDIIRHELNVVRVFENADIPEDIKGVVYSAD